MTVELYVAPATAGKTDYVLGLVRKEARGLRAIPRVVVPSYLLLHAWRRRMADAKGAIGVRLLTFDHLYAECLNGARELSDQGSDQGVYTELSEPVQYRLIRAVVDDLLLVHYAPLADRPGFIQVLRGLIGELKAARVWPETFAAAVAALGDEPRLRELAQVYAAYQEQLQAKGWADRAGMGWLAVEALEEHAPGVARDWPLLVVDGFDNFTPVQLALLRVLSHRVGRMVVTLTGTADGSRRDVVHRRFHRTRRDLERELGVGASPLPHRVPPPAEPLAHLESGLFRGDAGQIDGAGAVALVEAPDRAGEVRAAFRWLKERRARDDMTPREVALLARDIAPYRPFIRQTAEEFGLPIDLNDGLPLRSNPAIAALLDLLRLARPDPGGGADLALPRRGVVEAWRSPYFDWSAEVGEGSDEPIGIQPGDADALDDAARWGRVIGGLPQWQETLDHLCDRSPEASLDEERKLPATVPVGAEARALRDKFRRFVRRLTPPEGPHKLREFVGWLEVLIGPDPGPERSSSDPEPEPPPVQIVEPTSLQIVAQAREGPEAIQERDVSALQALKDILRGLVWAEEALETSPVEFPRFLDDLTGAVEATFYRLPRHADREEILVADVIQSRGIPFRAVAVLGLAEGEFPMTLAEDPFLRDADRASFRGEANVPLEPSTESAEWEFFYETVTRPWEKLLFTRPRLADNGAPWQASPFWEEVRRLVKVDVAVLTSESVPGPSDVASWPELMESVGVAALGRELEEWARGKCPSRIAALEAAARVFQIRQAGPSGGGAHDGDLNALAATFGHRFGTGRIWSASRLEAYRACPFYFFVGKVLELEAREEPVEGLDARQLGNIYHHIFEALYKAPELADPTDLGDLLAALPPAAAQVLDNAPRREGFRVTAWWEQTRREIVENVRLSLGALTELRGGFVPYESEAAFGMEGHAPLVVRDDEDAFRLRGFIDRVDRAPDGRVRVVDYKTAGPSGFSRRAFEEGKKLQLPLYALAARDALGLGEPVEGFYWHVQHAEPSPFTLGGFDGGPAAAMEAAVRHAWEAVRGARRGDFTPHPPDEGCPSYCPAAGFCWHFRTRFGG